MTPAPSANTRFKRAHEDDEQAGTKRAREETFTFHAPLPVPACLEKEEEEGFLNELHAMLANTGTYYKIEPVLASQDLPPQLKYMIIITGHANKVEQAYRSVIPFIRFAYDTAVALGQADEWLQMNSQVIWLPFGGQEQLRMALESSARPIVDLCGRNLEWTTGDLVIPRGSTIRNGTMNLIKRSVVLVTHEGNRFENLTVKGSGKIAVGLIKGGGLTLERCHVEGGSEVAVLVTGTGLANITTSSTYGRLLAKRSSIHSSMGTGLRVQLGGFVAVEEQSSISDNGEYGVSVEGSLLVWRSSIDRNRRGNVRVVDGGRALLHHVSSDSSTTGSGWHVEGEGSSLTAHHSHASSNDWTGAWAGGQVTLYHCVCSDNGGFGLSMKGGSLSAHSCHFSSNNYCGLCVENSGGATLQRCVCSDNGSCGLKVIDGSLTAHSCLLSRNGISGLLVESGSGSSAALHSCECCDNGFYGLYVDGNDCVLVVQGSSRVVGNTCGNAYKRGNSLLLCLGACDLDGQAVKRR